MVNQSWRERQVYWLLVLAVVMLLWALAVGLTGGFVFSIGGMRLSSRSMRNALMVFSLAMAAAWAIAPRGRRRSALSEAWTRLAGPVDTARRGVELAPAASHRGCACRRDGDCRSGDWRHHGRVGRGWF
jgi:hypothetical protein